MDKVSNNVIPYNVLQTIISQVDSGYISTIEGYVVPNSFNSKSMYIPVYEFLEGKTSYNGNREIKNCGTYFLDYLLELDYGRTFVFRYSYEAEKFICSDYLSNCFKEDIKEKVLEELDEVALEALNSNKAINNMSEEEIESINKAINNYYKRVKVLSDNFKEGLKFFHNSNYYDYVSYLLFQKKFINNLSNEDFEFIKKEVRRYYNNYVYLSDLRRKELNEILPLEGMTDKVNDAINMEDDDEYRIYDIKKEIREYYDANFSLISFSKDDIRRLLSMELIKGKARELLDNDKPFSNMSKWELEIINDEVFSIYQEILLGSYNYKEALKIIFQEEQLNEVVLQALNGNKTFNEMSEEERDAINLELDNLYTKLRINISGLVDIFFTYLLKLNGEGVVSYIKHNLSNTDLAYHIMYTTGINPRSEYYCERGVNYEFTIEHIEEIFSKLYKYDLEYAIEYVKMINKMPILSVKRFIDTFFKFAKEGFKADFLNGYNNSIDDKDYDDIIKSNNMKKYFREDLESVFDEVDFNKYFACIIDEEELYLRRLRQNK